MTNPGRPFGRFFGILPHSREPTSRRIGKPASDIGCADQKCPDFATAAGAAGRGNQVRPSAFPVGNEPREGSIMGIKASPTVKAIGLKPVGEIVWLAVTLVEFAVIMGIVCWPLSAELLPSLATGAAAANRSVNVVPATSPSTRTE